MKTEFRLGLLAAAAAAATNPSLQPLLAAETKPPAARIGVYDSRAIAYAHFWSETHQRQLSRMAAEAKQARSAGNTNRVKELEAALKADGEQKHLRVFSTAPVDDVFAGLQERIPAIQKEARVERLASKWDTKTLREHQGAEQVDVTDRLLREFQLTEKQRRVAEELQKKPPLELGKAQKLMREGKL